MSPDNNPQYGIYNVGRIPTSLDGTQSGTASASTRNPMVEFSLAFEKVSAGKICFSDTQIRSVD